VLVAVGVGGASRPPAPPRATFGSCRPSQAEVKRPSTLSLPTSSFERKGRPSLDPLPSSSSLSWPARLLLHARPRPLPNLGRARPRPPSARARPGHRSARDAAYSTCRTGITLVQRSRPREDESPLPVRAAGFHCDSVLQRIDDPSSCVLRLSPSPPQAQVEQEDGRRCRSSSGGA
jgi:hypothetical protein